MADPTIASLLGRLVPDPVRRTLPFSPDFAEANEQLLLATSDAEVAGHLKTWVRFHQPCIFGRMVASASDLLSFCILTERDLVQPDSTIQEKIQRCRLEWRRRAFLGKTSGFMILALSKQIVSAAPDMNLRRLAVRLAELYLQEAIEADRAFHDRITLEIEPDHFREWVVGVNFFGAQGDGRWWQDHRVPGGIAFSMNSIGHMIRSGAEHNRAGALAEAAGEPKKKLPVDTLDVALRHAMQTINRSTLAPSGRATCLRPADQIGEENALLECPLNPIPPELAGKDWTKYLGWYHTDHTIPSPYFRPDVDRPTDVPELELDFTYLYDPRNIDHARTGPGVQTR